LSAHVRVPDDTAYTNNTHVPSTYLYMDRLQRPIAVLVSEKEGIEHER
jgi:hypothetical protein